MNDDETFVEITLPEQASIRLRKNLTLENFQKIISYLQQVIPLQIEHGLLQGREIHNEPVRFSTRQDPPLSGPRRPRACFNCGDSGHLANQCRSAERPDRRRRPNSYYGDRDHGTGISVYGDHGGGNNVYGDHGASYGDGGSNDQHTYATGKSVLTQSSTRSKEDFLKNHDQSTPSLFSTRPSTPSPTNKRPPTCEISPGEIKIPRVSKELPTATLVFGGGENSSSATATLQNSVETTVAADLPPVSLTLESDYKPDSLVTDKTPGFDEDPIWPTTSIKMEQQYIVLDSD
eukprot:Gregarina_sp_Poly_1__9103@NODE_558_length_7531_cov_98_785102_g439_i0_p3_GENE_NODE_558_length_7531_cov_98_785102_g439_i0NODE_558_length_7531_cov_98_785102_g439_i0_p3_ORF_typecomplete_len290_score38_55zfCCHC_3/PF13917_6/4e05zfCCHC/PF00098_23/9_9e05zfCCHC_4/PF14392_6/0_0043zfCCHC_5/PF14787_6/0_022YabP/PF07873_11/0_063_NODE_558_length_7531_cov_98_785102_g439_i051496018